MDRSRWRNRSWIGELFIVDGSSVDDGFCRSCKLREGLLWSNEGNELRGDGGATLGKYSAIAEASFARRLVFIELINTRLYGVLDWCLKYLSLSPDFNDAPQFLLDIVRGSFVSSCCCFCDDRRECNQKVVLLAGFRLLCYLCMNKLAWSLRSRWFQHDDCWGYNVPLAR